MARLVRATHFSTVPQRVARTSRAMTVKREYPSPAGTYPDAYADEPGHDGRTIGHIGAVIIGRRPGELARPDLIGKRGGITFDI